MAWIKVSYSRHREVSHRCRVGNICHLNPGIAIGSSILLVGVTSRKRIELPQLIKMINTNVTLMGSLPQPKGAPCGYPNNLIAS
jgi:hypothetical protein